MTNQEFFVDVAIKVGERVKKNGFIWLSELYSLAGMDWNPAWEDKKIYGEDRHDDAREDG